MSDNLNPKVHIDGRAIRRLREQGKLTQLYVAKVVGVTTDTVSRWENNRYPTIRRDNALLLAEALEVDLQEILLEDDVASNDGKEVVGKGARWRTSVVLLLFLMVPLGAVYYFFMQRQPSYYDFTSERLLPSYAVPSGTLPIRVRLSGSGDLKGMILREHFPKGWTLLQASPPPSSLDNIDGTARWIIKPGEHPDVISYLLQVPADADNSKEHRFSGEVIVNPRGSGLTYTVAGEKTVSAGPFHWADSDGNSVIDDSETLLAADAVDEMEQLHLSWDIIEKIWDAGRYEWDPDNKQFLPIKNSVTDQ